MSGMNGKPPVPRRHALVRAAAFMALWVIIAGVNPVDLAVGAIASVIATALSLWLLPPGQIKVSPAAFVFLILRFLAQSVVAGVDVARRALDPRLPLRPGFVTYHPQLPAGPKRDAFCTMTSLLPGTLPCGPDGETGVLVHCLDIDRPMAQQLATEEGIFCKALGGAQGQVRP